MENSTMLFKALLEFTDGLFHQLLVNLSGQNSQEWLEEYKKFLRKEPCWTTIEQVIQKTISESEAKILQFVSTVNTSATTAQFVVKEKFIVDISNQAKVKIRYLGSNFIEWFGEKIEEPIDGQVLDCHKLLKKSIDKPIIAELGGEEKSETTLAEIYDLIAQQADGRDGILLNNGKANIFYARDINGVLRAVHVYWSVDGWFVYAYSVELPLAWYDGRQVFSRNLVLKIFETSNAEAK